MNGVSKKRAMPAKIAKMRARKKQKLENPEPVKSSNSGRPVRLDELRWSEVSMPDSFEDYEGFYGLEEIEGVDVIKQTESGVMGFRTLKEDVVADKKEKYRRDRLDDDSAFDREQGDAEASFSGSDDGEEWTGFEEEDKSLQALADESNSAKNNTSTPSKHFEHSKLTTDAQLSNGAFALLEQEVDEEEGVDVSAWKALNLSQDILGALSKLKFAQPTPIQSASIPHIIEGNDMIGKAPTGSGKTLAFGIPIIEQWLAMQREKQKSSDNAPARPIALVILPTRELALQIQAHLDALCDAASFDSPMVATLTGGLSIQKQRRLLAKADVVVATPGRLWEIISEEKGMADLFKQIDFLVIDEADRLLTEGHFKELELVLDALDRKIIREGVDQKDESSNEHVRQTLVFSATFSKNLQYRLSKRAHSTRDHQNVEASMEYLLRKLHFHQDKPTFIDVNPVTQMPSTLVERLVEAPGAEKDLYLYAILLLRQQQQPHPFRALVFVNSISAVRRLVPFLTNLNLGALSLHSQMPQKARLRSIERFTAATPSSPSLSTKAQAPSTASSSILIATDVAARGLDIPNIPLVVHYHVPRAADTYIHRSGRTARASTAGTSILICSAEEAGALRRLIAQVHTKTSATKKSPRGHLESLPLDTRLIARLRPRATLSKKLADSAQAKEKKNAEDAWLKEAADDLGVDLDDADALMAMKQGGGKKGRGKGREMREEKARQATKGEMAEWRAELRGLLSRRVNLGVSERYITGGGGVDVDMLLAARGQTMTAGMGFLGRVEGM